MSSLPYLQTVNLDRQSPLREQVYQGLRELIITGQMPPRSTVNEVAIASQLGISRTPVREAVKKLSDECLIEVFAQNGTFVAPISRAMVEEAYIIRKALETESTSRAALLITEVQGRALEDIILAHERAITRGDFVGAIRHDDDFHRYIAEINGFLMLWRAVGVSKAQMDRARHLAVPQNGWGEQTIEQHRAVLLNLTKKNAELAAKAMGEHLSSSLDNTLIVAEE